MRPAAPLSVAPHSSASKRLFLSPPSSAESAASLFPLPSILPIEFPPRVFRFPTRWSVSLRCCLVPPSWSAALGWKKEFEAMPTPLERGVTKTDPALRMRRSTWTVRRRVEGRGRRGRRKGVRPSHSPPWCVMKVSLPHPHTGATHPPPLVGAALPFAFVLPLPSLSGETTWKREETWSMR